MKPELEGKYEALCKRLQVDLLRIDQEIMNMPQLVQESAEFAALIQAEEHAAKHALDVVEAETAKAMRVTPVDGKPPSEARIASELVLYRDVQDARQALDTAKYDSARAVALHYNMREKTRLLGKAADMTIAGFIVPSSYAPRRRELANRAGIGTS